MSEEEKRTEWVSGMIPPPPPPPYIGAKDAGRIAGLLGQCTSLPHLKLGIHVIGDEGAGRLAELLQRDCLSLS